MNLPRECWRTFSVKSKCNEVFRCFHKTGNMTSFYSLVNKNNVLTIKLLTADLTNCLYTKESIDRMKVDYTDSIYKTHKNVEVECYKLFVDGNEFYIPVQAFNDNLNHLGDLTELSDSDVTILPAMEAKSIMSLMLIFFSTLEKYRLSFVINQAENVFEIISKEAGEVIITFVKYDSFYAASELNNVDLTSVRLYTMDDFYNYIEQVIQDREASDFDLDKEIGQELKKVVYAM